MFLFTDSLLLYYLDMLYGLLNIIQYLFLSMLNNRLVIVLGLQSLDMSMLDLNLCFLRSNFSLNYLLFLISINLILNKMTLLDYLILELFNLIRAYIDRVTTSRIDLVSFNRVI